MAISPTSRNRSAAARKRPPPPKMSKAERVAASKKKDAEIAAGLRPQRTKEKIERPYVAVDFQRHITVVLFRGPEHVYHAGHNGRDIRISRTPCRTFDSEFHALTLSENMPYPVQKAARKFLDWSKYAGITDAAHRVFTQLSSNRELSMSSVEQEVSAQPDAAAATPNAAVVAAAVEKKTRKSSTKNGTTAASKRAGKAVSLPPASVASATAKPAAKAATTKESTMAAKKASKKVAKTSKPNKTGKPAAKKAAAKTPVKAAAKKAGKPNKKTNGSADTGRAPSIPDDYIISKVQENPKREGTDAFTKYSKYKVGMTVGAVLAKNVDRADMNYNVKRGFVAVKRPAK
jgi:hypothetical protein